MVRCPVTLVAQTFMVKSKIIFRIYFCQQGLRVYLQPQFLKEMKLKDWKDLALELECCATFVLSAVIIYGILTFGNGNLIFNLLLTYV